MSPSCWSPTVNTAIFHFPSALPNGILFFSPIRRRIPIRRAQMHLNVTFRSACKIRVGTMFFDIPQSSYAQLKLPPGITRGRSDEGKMCARRGANHGWPGRAAIAVADFKQVSLRLLLQSNGVLFTNAYYGKRGVNVGYSSFARFHCPFFICFKYVKRIAGLLYPWLWMYCMIAYHARVNTMV